MRSTNLLLALILIAGCSSSEPSTSVDGGEDAAISTSPDADSLAPDAEVIEQPDGTITPDAGPLGDDARAPEVDGGAPPIDGGSCEGAGCVPECSLGTHACGSSCVDNTQVATCGTRCDPCPEVANGSPTCDGTQCGLTCNAGFDDCDHDPSNGCEADLADEATCGRCSNHCGANAACVNGACRMLNDQCANATPLDISQPRSTLSFDTTGFISDLPGCTGAGADAFFRIDLVERELVYADTFGSTFDTALYFASSCTEVLAATTTEGDNVCSDDACGVSQSQVVALLWPGTYYLVVSGAASGAAGRATLHFEHLPVGLGDLTHLAAGHATFSGTTSGQGRIFGCQALGPEASFWWANCPANAAGRLEASLCTGTSFDSVLELFAPRLGVDVCADDVCGIQAQISTNVPAGAGLNLLVVDGLFRTEQGAFTLDVTRP